MIGFACLGLLVGCTTRVETMPPRTAKEQVMLSYAVRDSMAMWSTDELSDRRVFLDTRYLDSIDDGFVTGEVRDWLGRQDAVVVGAEAEAEIRLELRSAGVGMESEEALVGIPSFSLPMPGTAPMRTPELAIYKDKRRKGVAALAMTAFDTQTDRRLFGHGPRIGETFEGDSFLLMVPIIRRRDNMPPEVELKRPEPREAESVEETGSAGEAAPRE